MWNFERTICSVEWQTGEEKWIIDVNKSIFGSEHVTLYIGEWNESGCNIVSAYQMENVYAHSQIDFFFLLFLLIEFLIFH